jgi:hypothetical protein
MATAAASWLIEMADGARTLASVGKLFDQATGVHSTTRHQYEAPTSHT